MRALSTLATIAALLIATVAPVTAQPDPDPPCLPLELVTWEPAPEWGEQPMQAPAPCTELLATDPLDGDVRTLLPNAQSAARVITLTLYDGGGVRLREPLRLTPPSGYRLAITDRWPASARTLEIRESSGTLEFGVSTWAWPQTPHTTYLPLVR